MRTDTDIYMWDVKKIVIERNDTKGDVRVTFCDENGDPSTAVTFHAWGAHKYENVFSAYITPEIVMVDASTPEPELVDEEPDV